MLPKRNRADKKAVEKIFKEGRFINSSFLTFKFLKNGKSAKNISFIAPKNIARLAVKRNLLRRRGYTALKKQLESSPSGIMGVFIFKKYQDDVSILKNEIKSIFDKIS